MDDSTPDYSARVNWSPPHSPAVITQGFRGTPTYHLSPRFFILKEYLSHWAIVRMKWETHLYTLDQNILCIMECKDTKTDQSHPLLLFQCWLPWSLVFEQCFVLMSLPIWTSSYIIQIGKYYIFHSFFWHTNTWLTSKINLSRLSRTQVLLDFVQRMLSSCGDALSGRLSQEFSS